MRPVGRFNTELLGVLRVEPRPTELHRLASNDAADGSSAEKTRTSNPSSEAKKELYGCA
jgi:hypothetical protein